MAGSTCAVAPAAMLLPRLDVWRRGWVQGDVSLDRREDLRQVSEDSWDAEGGGGGQALRRSEGKGGSQGVGSTQRATCCGKRGGVCAAGTCRQPRPASELDYTRGFDALCTARKRGLARKKEPQRHPVSKICRWWQAGGDSQAPSSCLPNTVPRRTSLSSVLEPQGCDNPTVPDAPTCPAPLQYRHSASEYGGTMLQEKVSFQSTAGVKAPHSSGRHACLHHTCPPSAWIRSGEPRTVKSPSKRKEKAGPGRQRIGCGVAVIAIHYTAGREGLGRSALSNLSC